jgi:hypothetical protein
MTPDDELPRDDEVLPHGEIREPLSDSPEPSPEAPTRRPRRRRERRAQPNTPDPRGPLLLLAGIGIAGAITAASLAVPPTAATPIPPPIIEPIDASVVICPEPGGADGAEVTSAIAIVPGLAGQDRPGVAALTYLGKPEDPVDAITGGGVGLTEPGGAVEVVNGDGRLRPLVTAAEGGLAPGLVAASYDLGLDGPRRGLATLNCPAPAPTWWFVGGGSTTGRTTQMYLVNPEASDAEVDISLAGPDGPISAPSLRGLIVPAESRTTIRLTKEAPAVASVVWQVQVRTGRIVAGVLDVDAEGFVPRGLDWIPPSAAPAPQVFIPGILGGEGRRRLVVHAPGEADALVRLRVLTPDGAYTPIELPEIEVLAGSVAVVDLTPAMEGVAGTLELLSDQPIVAGVRMRHEGVDASSTQIREDISFAAGAQAITDIAAVTGLPAVRGTAVTLWVTAPRPATGAAVDDSAATVTIDVLPFGEDTVAPEPISVTVPYDRAVPVEIARPQGASWFTAVVRADGEAGSVYVAQTSLRRGSRGSLISGYPLGPLRTTVVIPSAGRALGLAVGD